MILNHLILERAVILIKYIANVAALIVHSKALTWNKIMLTESHSLKDLELMEN